MMPNDPGSTPTNGTADSRRRQALLGVVAVALVAVIAIVVSMLVGGEAPNSSATSVPAVTTLPPSSTSTSPTSGIPSASPSSETRPSALVEQPFLRPPAGWTSRRTPQPP